jgi:hypothetical protein
MRDCHELPSRIKRHRKKERSGVAENMAAMGLKRWIIQKWVSIPTRSNPE